MEIKLLVGKRTTGKSMLLCDILKYNQKKEYICILQPNRLGIDNFELYNNFNKCIKGDFEYLEKMYIEGTKIHGIIIDDYRVFKNETLNKIIKMNSDVTIIIMLQTLMGVQIPLEILKKINQVFCFKYIKGQDQILFDYFGKQFETLEEFKKILDSSTNDYGCMVINKDNYTKLRTNQITLDQIHEFYDTWEG